jgi:muramoyltetrapeptide carboxypeptidase
MPTRRTTWSWSSCLFPTPLRPGDRVAVPAPAGPILPEIARAGLALLAERYQVGVDDAIFERTGFLAGSDERRADELNRYMNDPDIRAIIPARGGYGMMRILEMLDPGALHRDPKPIMGFSDITVLHAWCARTAQVRPIHGPMVQQLPRLPRTDLEWMFRILEDPAPPGPIPAELERGGDRGGGTVEGRLVGGNLELLTRLIGTPWQLDLGATILMIEDVGERPYRIDRMLTQLKLSGQLEGVRAAAIGDFLRSEEQDGSPPSAREVIEERLAAFEIPAVFGVPIGHGDRNLALPIGAKCAVDLTEGKLILEEGAVGPG